MNFNVLSNQVMLAHSHTWTQSSTIVQELSAHPLGAAILAEIKRVHLLLSGRQDQRAEIRKALRRLSTLLSTLDGRHDNLSRAIYSYLQALIQVARSPEDAKQYVDLLDALFPNGLRVLGLSYLGEAGAMIERTQRVTEPMLDLMAGLRLGDTPLLTYYKEWNGVAEEIGAKAQERARLEVSLKLQGTAITAKNTQAARYEWIGVTSAMMSNLAFIPLSLEAREMIVGPLTQSIQDALARRSSGNADDVDGDGDIDEDDLGEGDAIDNGDVIDNSDADSAEAPGDDSADADSAEVPTTT